LALVLHFIFGFSSSFVGMLTPSMLNMTTVKITLERGKMNAIKFAFGVSIVVLIQAYAAVFFTKFLKENPNYILILQKFALVILALLSLYFYREFKKANKISVDFKQKCRDTFVVGLFLSAINMFAIPFYYGITTFLNKIGLMQLSQNNILLFVIGSGIGTFILLYSYTHFGKYMQSKTNGTSNKLNLLLSILTGVLTMVTFIKLF